MPEIQEQITALRTARNAAEARIEQLTANQNAGNGVAHVTAYRAPKIPPFVRSNPLAWFAQAEITLRNASITASATKADLIAEKLDSDGVMCVLELLNKQGDPSSFICIHSWREEK